MICSIYIGFTHRVCWCLHVNDFFASCVINRILVTLHWGSLPGVPFVCSIPLMALLCSTRDLVEYYFNVTQTMRDISPLMHMHQDPVYVDAGCVDNIFFRQVISFI